MPRREEVSGMLRLTLTIAVVLFGAGARLGAASPAGTERNVVLFVVDDQGLDVGCYGNRAIVTPNLDRLAAEGTRFTHAFATTASCSASRSVILTGLHNHANGQYGHTHAYHHFSTFPQVRTLPVLLSQAGYRTARIGKFHVEPEALYRFDEEIPANPRSTVQMAERCREFIGARSQKPFFLYFCTTDPHRSGTFAEELPQRPDLFGNLPPGKSYPGVTPTVYEPKDVLVPPFLPDTPECRAELAQYYQSVSRIDQGLGRLRQILEEAGVWEETMLIYISDNGIAFPGAKTTVYEPGIRLPCIVRSPHQKKRGITTDAMVTWADIAPTILDFAGALPRGEPSPDSGSPPREAAFHGRSFLGILEEEETSGWDEIYASHTFHEITMYYPMRVVRTRTHKLIWNIAHPLPYPFASDLWESPTWQGAKGGERYGKRSVKAYLQRPRFELYDLGKDPDEVVNLAGDAAHAELLHRLVEKLKAFQKRTGDPWILKWDYE
jgi:N-sulfoglucosamine sulfohydrolase